MRYLFSQIIFAGGVLAGYFSLEVLRKKDLRYKENQFFLGVCISSVIWSLGFFGVNIQTVPQKAYFWRAIGMMGTFGYLIFAQYLICYLSGLKKVICRVAECFAFLGLIIYFFVIQTDQVTYKLTSTGMSYSFTPGIWNTLYIAYTVIVAINQLVIIIYMINNPAAKRYKKQGKGLLCVEVIMVGGMVLDTIMPILGYASFPGSTIGQFVGLAVLFHCINIVNKTRINIHNMSEFIYYSLDVPLLIYDMDRNPKILNDTAIEFLDIDKEFASKAYINKLFEVTNRDVFAFEGSSKSIDSRCLFNQKYCNLSINRIKDIYDDDTGYIIILSDLSEREKSMRELEEAMKVAEAANKAKSTFLANMSHEIRTPMNAIIGFSELLLRMDINDEIRSHVEDIKWSSHNLLAIINDILDISKIESGKMEIVPDEYFISSLLSDVDLIIAPHAKKKDLKFEMHVDETIPSELYGDKVRIRGILINILNNAVKYTQKGSITFEVDTVWKLGNKVKLIFRVTDTGMGIKQEDLNSLFDSFERLDQKVHYGIEGTGLGLAIAKGYVSLMGGEINVSSRYGEGTTFEVELEQEIVNEKPIGKFYELHREKIKEANESKFVIKDSCVLVVDDNPTNLKVAENILQSYGLEVDTAIDGKEAIALCKQRNYDIIFMDQMMPEMDGPQTMNYIRMINSYYAKGGDGKIIVLTANAIKGTREALMELGFDEYLGKPLNIHRMESLLCRFLPKEKILFGKSLNSASEKNEDLEWIQETLREVDVKIGLDNCGGTLEDYLKILQITYKYGNKQIEELRSLWNNKEYKDYNIKVHSLKSTAMNIGAKDISQEAKMQEEEGTKGNYEYIEKNMDKLLSEYDGVLKSIKEVLVHFGMMETENATESTKTEVEDRMMLPMLQNMENCIDNFDFGAVFSILEELKAFEIPNEYKEPLERIEALMDELAVEEIKAILHNLKKTQEA